MNRKEAQDMLVSYLSRTIISGSFNHDEVYKKDIKAIMALRELTKKERKEQ